ncbi:MAG: hypothetical protein M0R17_06860 [Candidatus Omnitrophica bacterium]|jgi:hypothetical protein|nr:hypothetical protein [Candidatus Omnitrophota bacterium]
MQKATKDLFIKLKALRPILHSISEYYGTDWKTDRLVHLFYLEYPNKHFTFNSEKELCDEIRRLIHSTESDLGFRFPETTKKLKLE